MNKVVMTGHLTRDVEIRYLDSGMAVATTAIATSRKYKDKEEVTFIDIKFFGKLAEIANQYLRKGSKLLIEGRLQQERWEKEGQKFSKHLIVIESMEMLDSKPQAEQKQEEKGGQEEQGKPKGGEKIPEVDIDEDEIPF